MPIPVTELIAKAAVMFRVTAAEITGPRRARVFLRPRLAVYLAARVSGRTYQQIGRIVGGRDHSTIVAGCDSAEELFKRDPGFRAATRTLIAMAENWQVVNRQEEVSRKMLDACKAEARERRRMAA